MHHFFSTQLFWPKLRWLIRVLSNKCIIFSYPIIKILCYIMFYFVNEVLETFAILPAMLLPTEIIDCLCCFLNSFLWHNFWCICGKIFSIINNILAVFTTYIFTFFLPILLHIFLAKSEGRPFLWIALYLAPEAIEE